MISLLLNKFLFSLGIRFVGETISSILAGEFLNIENLLNQKDIKEKLDNIDGFGPKVINSIHKYLDDKKNRKLLAELNNILKIKKIKRDTSVKLLSGKNIVFTGKLLKLSREEAKYKATQLGAKISNVVTSIPRFLIRVNWFVNKFSSRRVRTAFNHQNAGDSFEI